MSQTKIESFVEAVVNMAIGYPVAILSQLIIFSLAGIHVELSTNFIIGFYFAAISILRSYVIRRFFNSKLQALKSKLTRVLNDYMRVQ